MVVFLGNGSERTIGATYLHVELHNQRPDRA
jgi:hypothetical protein